jgi:hypothetical protein
LGKGKPRRKTRKKKKENLARKNRKNFLGKRKPTRKIRKKKKGRLEKRKWEGKIALINRFINSLGLRKKN